MARGKAKETVYLLSEMNEVTPTPKLNIESLREKRCFEPKDGTAYWYFECEVVGRHKGGCPKCGSVSFYAHGQSQKPRLIHDVNVGMRQVDISVSLPRYKCMDCGCTFMWRSEDIVTGKSITARLLEQIRYESFVMEFKYVASLHRISDSTVENIFDDYADDLEAARTVNGVQAPRVLGIDEKHIRNKKRGVFVNIETGEPLEMTEDNKKETMLATIESFIGHENIEIVTMDMANGYRSSVQECLPNAKIIIDKYHVIQDLNMKAKTIKKRIHDFERNKAATLPEHEKKLLDKLAKNSYLFKFSGDTLREDPRRVVLMADLCRTFPNFNTLRVIKEKFESIYKCKTREEAEAIFVEWKKLVGKSDKKMFAEFHTLRRSMAYWMPYVLNYFEPGCQVTNAATEGVNSLTERINIKGSGYSFKRLRAKLLFGKLATKSPQYIAERVRVSSATENTQYVGWFMPSTQSGYYSIVPTQIDQNVDVQSFNNVLSIPLFIELYDGDLGDFIYGREEDDDEEDIVLD